MIAIVRGLAPDGTMERSFQQPLMDIPKVPGIGLCLDMVCVGDGHVHVRHGECAWMRGSIRQACTHVGRHVGAGVL